MGAFRAADKTLDIQVGPNRFTMEQISLHIDTPERSVIGDLAFAGLTPWPVKLTSPGVMGWFAWIPRMQTYHDVISLDHAIQGTLTVNGMPIRFSDGRGYIEKDWGRSFPDAWIWMQTNHFDRPDTSLTASIATISWLGLSFRGFVIGLWHEGILYRFATYTGAQIESLAIEEDEIHAVIADRRYRLEVTARSAAGGVLRGPTGADMAGRVPESLRAKLMVRLSALGKDSSHPIFQGSGRNAGLEVVGETSRLLE
jgi:tocopherol cyclase